MFSPRLSNANRQIVLSPFVERTVLVLILAAVTNLPACRRPSRPSTTVQNVQQIVDKDRADEPLPYANMRLDVAYVKDSLCAECHQDISDEYAKHPMGNSLAAADSREPIEAFDEVNRPAFNAGPFHYYVRRDGQKLMHGRQLLPTDVSPVIKEEHEIAYAVGSGQKGRSYLINRNNRLFMSPLTWYPEKQIWDLSPGYENNDLGFDRPILEDCLFCHANQAHLVEHSKNEYAEPVFSGHAIGCQRCHGPGELHVSQQQSNGQLENDQAAEDKLIVNPSRLAHAEQEAICQQCHLAGVARVTRVGKQRYDFRPGQKLESTIATYVLNTNRKNSSEHFVGQVEQMYASQCFQKSAGKLGCISCHDPHSLPAEEQRVSFYRERCVRCHSDESCAIDLSQRTNAKGVDDCIACHMPKTNTDVRHAANTNHRILRDPKSTTQTRLVAGGPIVPFPKRTLGGEIGQQRDYALALQQAVQYHADQISQDDLAKTLLPLKRFVIANSNDLDASEGLADLLLMFGRKEAMMGYQAVLRIEPQREHSLVKLAEGVLTMTPNKNAVTAWQAAKEINPWMAVYQSRLAEALAQQGNWSQVDELANQATKLFPMRSQFWTLLVESKLRQDDVQAAKRAVGILTRLKPESGAEIRQWFEQHPLRPKRH